MNEGKTMTVMNGLLRPVALVCAFGLPAAAQQITGAGATFPAPRLRAMGRGGDRPRPGIELNYQAIGSGGGIKQIKQPYGRLRRLR